MTGWNGSMPVIATYFGWGFRWGWLVHGTILTWRVGNGIIDGESEWPARRWCMGEPAECSQANGQTLFGAMTE